MLDFARAWVEILKVDLFVGVLKGFPDLVPLLAVLAQLAGEDCGVDEVV